jgi:hypothetical protein
MHTVDGYSTFASIPAFAGIPTMLALLLLLTFLLLQVVIPSSLLLVVAFVNANDGVPAKLLAFCLLLGSLLLLKTEVPSDT